MDFAGVAEFVPCIPTAGLALLQYRHFQCLAQSPVAGIEVAWARVQVRNMPVHLFTSSHASAGSALRMIHSKPCCSTCMALLVVWHSTLPGSGCTSSGKTQNTSEVCLLVCAATCRGDGQGGARLRGRCCTAARPCAVEQLMYLAEAVACHQCAPCLQYLNGAVQRMHLLLSFLHGLHYC